MTSEEKQEIINAVLAALRTNSKTISQLTPVSALSDDDSIEIGGGKRVTYAVLKSLIEVLYSAAIESGINANNEIFFSGSKLKMSAVPDELNAALNEYFEACVRQDSDHLVDLLYSRIVLLDSMGSELDGLSYTPVAGDLVWRNGYVFKWNGTAWEDGAVQPRKHVLYINKHTGKQYRYTGSAMVEILSSGGGGASSVTMFDNYDVAESVSALPATGVATTGYIVGTHIYAYVGTGGDTRDGKYQDLGALEAAGVSVTTAEDGTFTIHAGGNDYTVNLNHTHPNMCKLVVCEESDLPSTLAMDTIYAQVDDVDTPTEIQSLWIAGLEFVGGGGSSTPTYDAEIEYLQATGTQFINTAIGATSNFECEIKAELTENQGIFDTILGACENVNDKIYSIPLAINSSGEFYVQFKDNFASKSANATGLHVFKSKLINNVVTIDVDGSTASTNIAQSSGSITNIDLFLFARNMAGVADRLVKAKIYYCKILNNGSLVCDFIPVRVGQVGYMYDRVRNRLFGNRGTGSFTLGNDKQ